MLSPIYRLQHEQTRGLSPVIAVVTLIGLIIVAVGAVSIHEYIS